VCRRFGRWFGGRLGAPCRWPVGWKDEILLTVIITSRRKARPAPLAYLPAESIDSVLLAVGTARDQSLFDPVHSH
jgi:hypothetical protein